MVSATEVVAKPLQLCDKGTRRDSPVGHEGEGNALRSRLTLGCREAWECFDGKRWVTGGARLDESSRERVDFVQAECRAIWICWGDLAEIEALKRRVDRFCDEDGPSNAEIFFAADETCSTKVGRSSNTLEHRGKSNK